MLEIIASVSRRNVTPVARFFKVSVTTVPGRLFYVCCAYIEDQVFHRKTDKKQTAPKTAEINIRKCKLITGKK